jgi:hypothetical protein
VRTNDDKRRAVLRMLTDPEWRQWPLRKIEKHCGVSIGLVQSTAWRIFACTSLGLECPLIVYTIWTDHCANFSAWELVAPRLEAFACTPWRGPDAAAAASSPADTVYRGSSRIRSCPPSMGSSMPVTQRDSSLARYTAAQPTSQPVPAVWSGMARRRFSSTSAP